MKKDINLYSCCMAVIAFVLITAIFVFQAHGEIYLAHEGKPEVSIFDNGHAAQAGILQEYIEKIAGVFIPIIPTSLEPDQKQPVILLDVVDSIPGTSNKTEGMQAYRIYTDENRIYLIGRSEIGLTYAVYGFLEDYLGVCFYSDTYEVVPQRKTLKIGSIDETQEPAFSYRGFIRSGSPPQKWLLKNRGGGSPDINATHNLYEWISPERYFESHPEWFPLIGSKRERHYSMTLCFTNGQLAVELAENLMKKMAEHDPNIPIPVGQGDGFAGCQCQDCRRVVQREDSEAAPLIMMLNQVLEKTTKKFPRHQIITFAYFETLKAPRTIRPHSNLWVNIVSSSINQGPAGDQLGRIRNNPRNKDYQEAIEQWTKLASGRVIVWDWSCNFFDALMEWPNIFNICDNIRLYHENDVTGIKLQMWEGDGNWGWLRRWLWTKLMWNPDADVNNLTKQFLADYYGPKAAPYLWRYLQYVTKVAYESGYAASVCRGAGSPDNVKKNIFQDDKLVQMNQLLTAAENAVTEENNPIYAEHVAHVRPTTIDTFAFIQAGPLSKVKDPRDGTMWLVPGGKADMPARIDRVAGVLKTVRSGDDGAAWYYRYRFLARQGGPVSKIENERLSVEIVPNIEGQITSIVHKPTGRQILWTSDDGRKCGYRDVINGVRAQEWKVKDAKPDKMLLLAQLLPNSWGHHADHHMHRAIVIENESSRILVKRWYSGREVEQSRAISNPAEFNVQWSFRIPKPDAGRVNIVTEGFNKIFIPTEGKKETFSIPESEKLFTLIFDRHDGLIVKIISSAEAFKSITLDSSPSEMRLSVTLTSIPYAMDSQQDKIDLPVQVLEVSEETL